MSQQHDSAAELKEAQEVGGLPVPAQRDTAKSFEPSKQPLDQPTAPVAPQRPTVLLAATVRRVHGRDELDVALLTQTLGELVAVEGLVRDQLLWEVLRDRFVEGLVDKDTVVSRTICDANGERKTRAVCKRHDLRRMAGTAFPDAEPPFFAPT